MLDIKELQILTSTMSVLYVEDDLEVQNNTKMIFEDLFQSVTTADDGQEGLELYKKNNYDIVITDINMPKMNGIELIREVKSIDSYQVIIIISAHNETEYLIDGIQNGIFGYILKPINYEQLFDSLNNVANLISNRRENLEYKEHMQKLVQEKTDTLEKNYQQMEEMLTTDKVTGLPNTNVLYQFIDFYSEENLSILLLKIDNFNYIKQSYSSEICNEIINNTSKFIQYNLPKDCNLYKYSEEEFIVIFENGDKEYFIDLATQINACFKETAVTNNKEEKDIYITLSCAIVANELGISILQKAKATINELDRLNIYGHFKVYEENLYFIKELKNENYWFEKIREIIENDKLIPYFHPIVSNETKKIIRYECLVRADDAGDIISPVHFLEAAKKTGLMENLSKIMINKCFSFFSNSNIPFNINITNEDLLSKQFVDFVLAKQKQYNIKAELVVFEILEDIIFDGNHKIPIENLARLKQHGFLLALDDFGSDRSNLSRLVSIVDLDFIKIDGQFIRGIDKNPKNYDIVESIVQLAHKLDIVVVAEFVSTIEEFEIVKNLGLEGSQGYYFFKPKGYI